MKHPDLISNDKVLPFLERARGGKYYDTGKLGHPVIDEFLRFKDGEFVVVTGHANVGKTHTLIYLMLMQTMNYDKKWLVYSSENEVHSLKRKLIEFLSCEPIQNVTEAKMYRHLDYIDEHFRFIDSNNLYNAFDLLRIMEEIHEEWQYTGCLIDPYNSLVTDQKKLGKSGMHEYHYEVASAVRIFAHKNAVTTIVNTHPVTEAMRRTHPNGHAYAGLPTPPMTSDIEGGGKWGNRADSVVIIHRYAQHLTDWVFTEIHCRKTKEMETGGRPTPLSEPIRLRSMKGNVGFTHNNLNLLDVQAPIQTIIYSDDPF